MDDDFPWLIEEDKGFRVTEEDPFPWLKDDDDEDEPDGLIGHPNQEGYAPYLVYLTEDDDTYVETYNRTENGYVYGLGGDDTIHTRSFGVSVFGGEGSDTLIWSYQPPRLLDGGDGVDTLDLSLLPRGAEVNLATGEAKTFVPLFLPDRGPVEIRSIENVTGTDHADTIWGDGNDNVLDGRGGGDFIAGGAGNDTIIAGTSEPGRRDVLMGGADSDTFQFRTAEENLPAWQTDVVMDFEQGSDILAFETAYGFGSITFLPASEAGDTVTWLDPRQNYLATAHTSQPGLPEVTEVSLWLTTGSSHEYAGVTLIGHHDLTAGDFMFV